MTYQPTLKVLVMHGEHLIDAGLATSLTRHADIEVVPPCPTSTQDGDLPSWIARQTVDVVITDYSRGVALVESLRVAQAPSRPGRSRIVIVTSRATQNEIQIALKRGVAGYLTVTSPEDEVIDAVRKVHRGMRHVSEPLARLMLEGLLGDGLTLRESEVLRLAAKGCPNKVIAARLRVELGTVKSHMKAVFDKLSASNRTEAVVIASQRGLLVLEKSVDQGMHSGEALKHPYEATTHSRHPHTPSEMPQSSSRMQSCGA